MKAINSLEVCQKPRVVATTADRVVRLNMGWDNALDRADPALFGCGGSNPQRVGCIEGDLVDPEKVIFRHIEVEHWKHSGLAERVGCSILSSGRR